MTKPTVAVAMSGGVDSSVAAALLVEQGYPVIGIMLRLWSEPGQEDSNRCCTPDAMAQARRVAARLGIPFYALNAQKPFFELVVQNFIEGYLSGQTPNPCTVCNRWIRWDYLLNFAFDLGAQYLATGHYARLVESGGRVKLLRGADSQKDQSYVLSVLTQAQLQKTMLPLGELTKPEVREIARRFGLSAAERQDSQDLCFLAGQDYRSFLLRHAPQAEYPGKILDTKGNVLGQHNGLAFYTIGQRKGLGLQSSKPMYVIQKKPEDNLLVVGYANELGFNTLVADQVSWVSGELPDQAFRAEVKIRYKAAFASAEVHVIDESHIRIEFDHNLRDITPGQRAVIYVGDEVMGGGRIIRATVRNMQKNEEGI